MVEDHTKRSTLFIVPPFVIAETIHSQLHCKLRGRTMMCTGRKRRDRHGPRMNLKLLYLSFAYLRTQVRGMPREPRIEVGRQIQQG
jgi:hypothetical protein